MRRGVRFVGWAGVLVLAAWGIGAGVITVIIASPSADIDGPV